MTTLHKATQRGVSTLLLRQSVQKTRISGISTTPYLLKNSDDGAHSDGPPRLLVVQPRVRPNTLLQSKLSEAVNLANSLDEQRDGCFSTDLSQRDVPPHLVVQNPLGGSHKGRSDTYFGPGTVQNIKCHIHAVESQKGEFDGVFVNAILSAIQQRNLERVWDKPVLDRVGLIIEIFHAHAYTKEAKLQAELAALMYKKSRLVRVRGTDGRYTFGTQGEAEVVSARGRGSGGRGFISGAGETELELQRRRISERRKHLLAELAEVRKTRAVQRAGRRNRGTVAGRGLATVAVVGYTNAGKSTLVSALSDSDLYSDDRLFATVDPRVRGVTLPSGRKALLSDTVGFISDLPVQLVEAFHATLEEVIEADLLVHVLDSSAANLEEQRKAVLDVLRQIGVSEKKIKDMVEVWNKVLLPFGLPISPFTFQLIFNKKLKWKTLEMTVSKYLMRMKGRLLMSSKCNKMGLRTNKVTTPLTGLDRLTEKMRKSKFAPLQVRHYQMIWKESSLMTQEWRTKVLGRFHMSKRQRLQGLGCRSCWGSLMRSCRYSLMSSSDLRMWWKGLHLTANGDHLKLKRQALQWSNNILTCM